jgi:hypothetical protein
VLGIEPQRFGVGGQCRLDLPRLTHSPPARYCAAAASERDALFSWRSTEIRPGGAFAGAGVIEMSGFAARGGGSGAARAWRQRDSSGASRFGVSRFGASAAGAFGGALARSAVRFPWRLPWVRASPVLEQPSAVGGRDLRFDRRRFRFDGAASLRRARASQALPPRVQARE